MRVQARHGSEVAAWEQETGEDFVTDLIDTAALASSPLDQYGRAGSTEEEVRVLGLTLVDRGASEKFGGALFPSCPLPLYVPTSLTPSTRACLWEVLPIVCSPLAPGGLQADWLACPSL